MDELPRDQRDFGDKLKEIMDGIGERDFKTVPIYNDIADSIDVFFENAPFYGEFINRYVTIFRAEDDNRIVGVDISQVSDIKKLSVDEMMEDTL